MTSILTNYGAMAAVQTLTATQNALAATQRQISTGLKVSSAKDNAAYWSIATSMKTRIGELLAVNDGLDVTSGVLSTTAAALDHILTLTQAIAQDVVSAQTAGVDQAKIAGDIAAKQQGIIASAKSASYNGVNWLVDQNTNIYSGTHDQTWAGSYADVYLARGTTPISYTSHATDTIQAIHTQGSSSSSTTTTSYDDVGTLTPSTGHFAQHIVAGATTTTGETGNDHNVDLLLTTGPATTFDLQPLNLFGTSRDVSGGAVDHETFAGQDSRYFTSFFIFPAPNDISLSGGGALVQSIALSGGATTTALTFDATSLSQADLAAVGSGIDEALGHLQNAMSVVGSLQNEIDSSKRFNSVLADALQSGVGSLVDADMNATSTRLMALQTQQQLGIQALGIANDNSQIILKLFGS